jgi:molybdenum cofactor synthesis domain-containing protein
MSFKVFEADIVATGSELTYGQLVDTNSPWLADLLTRWGGLVRKITIVGDRIDDIVSVLQSGLREKLKLIVITGGLGPTEDDLTVEAIAKTLGRKTVFDEAAIEMVRAKCNQFKLEFTERRKLMARSVEGASLLNNSIGLAPGAMVEVGETTIVALPGIPKEMKPMFESEVLPKIQQWAKGRMSVLNLRAFCGSEVFSIFRRIQAEFPDIYLKFHAQAPSPDEERALKGMELTIIASGPDELACIAILEKASKRLEFLLQEKGGRLEKDN